MEKESVIQLSDAKIIAEHVARMLLSMTQYPTFAEGNVPVSVAAKAFGKDASWVQACIIYGWLPIGRATQDKKLVSDLKQINSNRRTNYYISTKLLWELTGYVWDGR